MAEHHQQHTTGVIKSYLPDKAPSTSQVVAVVTLFPVASVLLCLAGIILTGTLIGLAVATPVFVLFSPILVPAVLAIILAVSGFLTSGAFGITALSSISWLLNYVRRSMRGSLPEHARTAGHFSQRAQDVIRP